MPYLQTDWKDHVVENPKTYTVTDNGDGTYTYTDAPGEIIQQGTPMSATNFNKQEMGIEAANLSVDLLFSYIGMKLGFTDLTLDGVEATLAAEVAKITGGDTVAAKAVTLTQVLGVLLGGTGASTVAGARTNLDVPSNTDLAVAAILQSAIECVTQAYQRDLDSRIAVIEAGLA